MDYTEQLTLVALMHHLIFRTSFFALMLLLMLHTLGQSNGRRPRRRGITYSITRRIPYQVKYLDQYLNTGDEKIKDNLRMNRACFAKLCQMLHEVGGLRESKYVTISAQVSMFIDVLSHHLKNRKIRGHYIRSGETVSRYFKRVLLAVLKLHPVLLSKPTLVQDDETDFTWKNFKGCLGALDGTHIGVLPLLVDKPRYWSRKTNISSNVLCVCDRKGSFVYVLAGWEGSAADSRILKDAMTRPNGFKIPQGCYYLVDGGYANAEEFLAPYRGVRYHLREWESGRRAPQNYQEYFNMKHARARNVIECSFAALKIRWAILRKYSYFRPKTHNQILMACLILHNYIMREVVDAHLDENYPIPPEEDNENDGDLPHGYVEVVESTPAWTAFRDEMAMNMYNEWMATRS